MSWILCWLVVSCIVSPLIGACIRFGLNGSTAAPDEDAEAGPDDHQGGPSSAATQVPSALA